MSSFAAAKAKWLDRQEEARRRAGTNVEAFVGRPLNLGAWSGRTLQAYEEQWLAEQRHNDAGWDWPEIIRRYRNEPDAMSIAMWSEARLSGLALATTSAEAVTVKFLEGDPRPDCPLRGLRALIAVEAAMMYGQGIGRREVRVEPVNDTLATMYCDMLGFALAKPPRGAAYYVRVIP
ncbi:hypothetical protein MMB17_07290 [Methylobacterium organophilum]|uniref:hypothetical protein n=1 Tax=Methylobacterium organophilum TaxID=410 RepID=UPI001F12E933|nr:hypothetical protein [Methylobacterium organophilum]UMY19094.1 hypothetical protein MMB17_07290 [Methylobacterium organophilum]